MVGQEIRDEGPWVEYANSDRGLVAKLLLQQFRIGRDVFGPNQRFRAALDIRKPDPVKAKRQTARDYQRD